MSNEGTTPPELTAEQLAEQQDDNDFDEAFSAEDTSSDYRTVAPPAQMNNEPDPEQQPTLQPVEQPATAAASFTHVITAETAYYTGGPQQGRPPGRRAPVAHPAPAADL